MFSFNQQRLKILGVMNVTPNSFSDGGTYNTPTSAESKFKALLPWIDGLDIGAESTAPMNSAITAQEEQKRLSEFFLPWMKVIPPHITLSLDTYHVETMEWFMQHCPQNYSLIWNDISGRLDQACLGLLRKHSHLSYVYSFTTIPERSKSLQHAQFALSQDISLEMKAALLRAQEIFQREGMIERVIIDPGFGFSKKREQNGELLQHLASIMDESPFRQWMIGLSRKSFLRFTPFEDAKNPETQKVLDGLQLLLFADLLKKIHHPHTIWARVHDPLSLRPLEFIPKL